MKARTKLGSGRTLALRSEAKRRASQPSGTCANQPSATSRSIINHQSQPTSSSLNSITKRQATTAYTCAGCDKPIKRDRFLLKACDKFWHENCLKCERCGCRLGELDSTFYTKSDMNLCRRDYLELFGRKGTCTVCNKLIRASELVMRARENVYHLECFACQLCNQRFCVGDQFYLCDNKVVCQYDYLEHIVPLHQSLHALASSSSEEVISATVGCVEAQHTTDNKPQFLDELDKGFQHHELTLLASHSTKQEHRRECNTQLLTNLSEPLKSKHKDVDSISNLIFHDDVDTTSLPETRLETEDCEGKQQPVEVASRQSSERNLLGCDISIASSSSSSSSSLSTT